MKIKLQDNNYNFEVNTGDSILSFQIRRPNVTSFELAKTHLTFSSNVEGGIVELMNLSHAEANYIIEEFLRNFKSRELPFSYVDSVYKIAASEDAQIKIQVKRT